MIYILKNRPGNGSFLPFQSATDDMSTQRNPAYITKEDIHMSTQRNPAYITQKDIHTYDYVPDDGMILTLSAQCPSELPPELPPGRKVQEEDPNDEGKG